MATEPAAPDLQLAERVSPLGDHPDPIGFYLEYGRRIHDEIVGLLPSDWDWEGTRMLDFGCGAGRILRHFLDQADAVELHGCEIHEASVDWLRRHMSPPVHPLLNGEAPPLDRPDEFFDLIYAVSVFTHITDQWAAWLVELHRILRPGGILIATFMGEGMMGLVTGERWNPDLIGMNVLSHSRPWDRGGPAVITSPWWIREHWGRAFEILELRPQGFAVDGGGQGVVVMRRREVRPSVAELEAIDPLEPREISALRHNIAQLHAESQQARHWLDVLQESQSWKATAPLRSARAWLRGR